jgi:transposase InsO family protein
MRFVVRHEAGERMTDLCREFGISRKTGYKIWDRYQLLGPEALGDFSRRPHRHPNRTPQEILDLVVQARGVHPTWGPKKLRVLLLRQHPGVPIPAASTIGEMLKREGLSRPRRRRRRSTPTPHDQLTVARSPNDVWCVDYKGQFRMGNRLYCYPLTVTDLHSRFLVCCEALESTRTGGAMAGFLAAFREYGLPKVIRSDNGSPFASVGLAGLSRLSVWWMRLGIRPERIESGHPEQNGQHERMHLTLKEETTRPPGAGLLQQQERFDGFRETFNQERPHEALEMKRPADLYSPSERRYQEVLEEPEYPLHDRTVRISVCGHIKLRSRWHCYLATSLAGQRVGLREVDNGRWLVSFLSMDLGHLDERTRRFVPAQAAP